MLQTQQLKGKTMLVHGEERTVISLLISSAVKMQDMEKVLFIDTLNCFTPNYVTRHFFKKLKKPLDRIFISRPTNVNELSLFVYRLDQLFQKTKIRVLVISAINTLFFDLHKKEIETSFIELMRNLSYLTKKYNLVTIIGNINEPNKNCEIINKIISQSSDKVYAV